MITMENFTDRNNRLHVGQELRTNVFELFKIAEAMGTLGMSQASHAITCCQAIIDLSHKLHDMANRDAEVYQQHIQKMGGVLLETANVATSIAKENSDEKI
jgi:hypothetical protein